jgi:hypothetical protein
MDYWKIEQLQSIYTEYLAVLDIAKKTEKQYAAELMGPGEEKYHNPFRVSYDFERTLATVRDDVVRAVKGVYNETYPNVDLEKIDFKNLFTRNEYGHHDGLVIDWNGLKLRLLWLETKADELAMNELDETALRTVPNYYHRTELKMEELLRGKTVQLDGHFYSYDRIDEWRVGKMRKWLAVVLEGARASQTTGMNAVEIKPYKNGRTDVKLRSEEEAKKVANALVSLWKVKNKKT